MICWLLSEKLRLIEVKDEAVLGIIEKGTRKLF